MRKYIDTEKFYAEAVKWESQALTVLASLDPNVDYTEYAKWSVILNERTSFKHDIMDAPKADVEEVRHGEWIPIQGEYHWSETGVVDPVILGYKCSVCGDEEKYKYKYCHCGAKMDLTEVK